MAMLMTSEEKTAESIRRAAEASRHKTTGDTAIVRCTNIECLGVRGEDGIWRDTYGNILNVVRIVAEL
jgi:hypothetical protein